MNSLCECVQKEARLKNKRMGNSGDDVYLQNVFTDNLKFEIHGVKIAWGKSIGCVDTALGYSWA